MTRDIGEDRKRPLFMDNVLIRKVELMNEINRSSFFLIKSSMVFRGFLAVGLVVVLNVISFWFLRPHAYPELLPQIANNVREILKKHGMPVQHDRPNPWLGMSGILGDYTIYFYLADEIPEKAKLETIKLCMDLYEERGRKEQFKLVMYHENHEKKKRPFFELILKGDR